MAEESGGDGLGFGDLSPLMTAIVNQDIDSVEHLARAGADLEDGDVLLSAADDITVLQALIDGGVDINTPNGGGLTTLMVAAIRGEEKKIDNLISSCANRNTTNREGATALMLSAVYGHSSIVLRLLDAGADPNPGVQGFTPLMTAIASNDLDLVCVERLLEAGADVNARSQEGDTALCLACRKGLTLCVQVLVNAGADMNLLDSDQNTPLMLAAVSGHSQIVDFLCKRGADLDVTNGNGATALMLSAIRGYVPVFLRLVQAGADPNLLGVQDFTPFMVIILSNDLDMICVERLLEAGADVNARSQEGSTALCLACREGLTFCSNILVNAGADVNLTDFNQNTPLMLAIESGHEQIADFLCENGADLDVRNGQGNTALCLASFRGQLSCVQALISARADINLPDLNQITPLMWAARQGHDQVVDFLCQAVADVDRTNFDGETALMFAANNGHDECVRILINAKAQVDKQSDHHKTALMFAATNGHEDCLRILIDAKAQVDKQSDHHKTALMFAANNGHEDCLRILIDAKARTDLLDNNGATALILAAIEGHRNCCEILISAGAADINQADETGMTPLMHAAKENKTGCLELLITSEAEINRADENGWTALMWARAESCLKVLLGSNLDTADKTGATALIHNARSGNVQCLQTLISAGAKLDLSDRDGVTPLLAAAQFGQEECLTVLVNKDPSFYKQADVSGKTAMIKCAEMGHERCLKILLSACDKLKTETQIGKENSPQFATVQTALNVCDVTGTTALVYAVQNKHLDCVKLLIESGADVNKKDKYGGTALMKAAKIGCREYLRVLIKADANVNSRDKKDNTALMWSVIEKHPKCLAKLTECPGFVADQENTDGMTPVMWAAQNGDTQCLQILLQFQADVTKKDRNGETALFKAAIKGGIEAVKVLLKKNESFSHNNGEDTSINYAECLRLMLSYMESQFYRLGDTQEYLPWVQVAAVTGDKYAEFKDKFLGKYANIFEFHSDFFVKWLSEKDPHYVIMAAAGYSGNVECLQTLLEEVGSGVRNNDHIKNQSLVWAVIGGHVEAVKFLIKKMQSVTLYQCGGSSCYHFEEGINFDWRTGPRAAIMFDNAEILQVLIDHKPDIVNNGTCCEKFCLLMFAAEKGKVECFKCLLDNNADVNVRGHRGETVLNTAILARYKYAHVADLDMEGTGNVNTVKISINDKWDKCVKQLLESGAHVDDVDEEGNSALIVAVKCRLYDYVQLLTDKGANLNYIMYTKDNLFNITRELYSNINITTRTALSALTLAMKNVWLIGFKFLLQKHLDANLIRRKGGTTEDEHCQGKIAHSGQHEHDQLNIVQFVIDNVANINCSLDTLGNTALILARKWYGQKAVNLLIESGAEVNQQNNEGVRALECTRNIKTRQYRLSVGGHRKRGNKKTDTSLTLSSEHSQDPTIKQDVLNKLPTRCAEQATNPMTAYKQDLLKTEEDINNGNNIIGETQLTPTVNYGGIPLESLEDEAKSDVTFADRITRLLFTTDTDSNDDNNGPQDTSSDDVTVSYFSTQDILRMTCKTSCQGINKKTFTFNKKSWLGRYKAFKKNKPCLLCLLLLYSRLYGYSQITEMCKDHKCSGAVLDNFDNINQELKRIKSAFGDYDKCLQSFVGVIRELSNAVSGETSTDLEFTTCGSEICESLYICFWFLLRTLNSWCIIDRHIREVAIYGHHKICVQLLGSTTKTIVEKGKHHGDELLHASLHGHNRCIKLYIDRGCDANFRGKYDSTTLMCAAMRGHDTCIQLLIKAGCSVDSADYRGLTALLYAAHNGHDQCVQLLIKADCAVDHADKKGSTALMLAAQNGHDKCVQLLIKANCAVDHADKKGSTALMLAAQNGHDQCVQLLIKADCAVDHADIEGSTTLMLAAQNGHDKCVQLLIEKGIRVDRADYPHRRTALMLAAWNGHEECVLMLVQAGSKLNAPDAYEETPLFFAAESGNKITVQLLIDHGAHIQPLWKYLFDRYDMYKLASSCVSFIFNPPMCPQIDDLRYGSHHVKCIIIMREILKENLQLCDFLVLPEASQGHVKCLQILQKAGMKITMFKYLKHFLTRKLKESDLMTTSNSLITVGADVNQASKAGKTLLMIFAMKNFVLGLNNLLKFHKVEKNKQDNEGFTALTWAVHKNAVQCTEALLSSSADVNIVTSDDRTCLMIAASKGHHTCLSLLLKYTRQLDVVFYDGHTALMMAAREGHGLCVKLLTDNGADKNKTNFSGETALMLAAGEGRGMCVKHLIDSGCDINVGSTKKCTAVMMAARRGQQDCLQQLITAQADLDIVDIDGKTALMHAAREGKKECLNLLIKAGVKLDLTDQLQNNTALMFAAEAGQVECVQLLLSAKANINFRNKNGKTAVMVAIEAQQGSCLYHLLTAGADVTLVNKNKKTAFETAIESDNLELVHIFVIGSSEVNFVNTDGLSSLMIALRSDKLRIARYLVSLTFMNMHDLKYRPTPKETANMSEEVSEFQENLYSQPWPLKKLCFILVSTELRKNPDRRAIVEQYLNVEPFRLTFMFRERTSGISNIEWHDLSSLLLPTCRDILQETEARIVDMEVSDAVKDWEENSDDSMKDKDEKEKDYEHDKVEGEKERYHNCNDGYDDVKNNNTIVFENSENDEEEGKVTFKKSNTCSLTDGDNVCINQSSPTTYPVPTTDRNYDNIITDYVISVSDNAKQRSICTDNRSENTETSAEHEDSRGFLDGTDSQPSSDNGQLLNQVNIRQFSTQSNTIKDAQKRGLETQISLNLILLSHHKVATLVNSSRPMLKTCLHTRLEEKSLKLWPVARDGDCLITATLRQDSTYKSVKELRDAICDHLLLNHHHYINFVSINDMNQFESKVELLRQPGHWNSDIGDVVPLVISNLLGRKIVIYSNNEHFPEIIITPDLCHVSGDDLLYVYHDSPGHYDNVKPAANFPPL